ncbi:MAG: TolC family protein [Campylobacterota bacterium]
MKTTLFFTLLLSSNLFGVTLEEIITTSLSKSPSLESINARIAANKKDIELSNKFSNPKLSLITNTLDSDQAMSKTTLTLQQTIPFYSKRDSKQRVAIAEENILHEKLRKAKVELVAAIKIEAYNIWELKELYKTINEYVILTEQNIELYESYATTTENNHMGIMKAKLSLSDLQITRSNLGAKIYSSLARLSYLAAFEVNDLDIKLKISQKPELQKFQTMLANSPELAIKRGELAKRNAQIQVADVNNYPDINLIGGYNYRENFDDFWSIGVGLSLPIYSREDSKLQKARSLALSVKSRESDTEISINSKVKVYFSQMKSSYEIYHIIQDDALPQIEHMFELSNSSISTGSELFKYVDVLVQKLKLEQKSINAITNYNRAYAKISQLSGAIK